MAHRYQNRPFPADDYNRGGDQPGRAESDPLAELARLIGQTDPFGNQGRANPPPPPRANPPERHQPQHEPLPAEEEEDAPHAGPPPWMQRANARVVQRETPREALREFPDDIPPEEDYPAPVYPRHRYAQPAPPEEQYVEEPGYDEAEEHPDPSRYDDALYGQIENGAQDYQRDPAYPNDPYAFQDGDDEEAEQHSNKRRGVLLKLVAVIALAVVGAGSALAYRTYVGSTRAGEPPIIKADNSPTKIVPAPADNTAKAPDRMPSGDGTEKIVSREEAPVDINAKSGGARVVFPPLSPNASPPAPASVSTSTIPIPPPSTTSSPTPSNGTLPNNEPRKIRTVAVRGDQADSAAVPVGAPPAAPSATATKSGPAPKTATARGAAPSGNAPLSLAPDQAPAPAARVATTTAPPTPAPNANAASGGYLVQVSSQRSETDAQASFKALQSKFPSVLGSQTPVIKRADLGDKGIYYRAMIGPFGTPEEASQFCGNLKNAGGQCVVQRN